MRVLLIFLAIVPCLLCLGQDPLPRLKTFTPTEYGQGQTPENWSITQDSAGIMYFGNGGGVIAYDHERWSFIPVRKGQFVRALCADKNSDIIYTGGEGQFGYLAYVDGQGQKYHSISDSLNLDFSFGTIWRIYMSVGKVFFQCQEAVFVFDPIAKEVTIVKPTTSYHLMMQCEDDIYVRERQFGLQQWNGKAFELVPEGEKFTEYGVFDILPYQDKRLLVTQELGLFTIDDTGILPLTEDSTKHLRSQYVIGGVKTEDDSYFLHSLQDGIIEIDHKGNILNVFNREAGLKSSEIKDMMVDHHGNLWLATGNGVSVINRSVPLSFYTNAVGLEGNVQCINQYMGSLLVGTSVGLYQQVEGRHRFVQLNLEEQVWDLEVVNDHLLIGTNNGLFVFDGITLEHLYNVNSEDLYFDRINNTVVVSGTNGVVVLDVINNYSVMQSIGTPLGRSMGVVKDPHTGSLWLGTTQYGVFRLDFDGFEYVFEHFDEQSGLVPGEWVRPFIFKDSVRFGTTTEMLTFNKEDTDSSGQRLKGYFLDYTKHPFGTGVSFQGFTRHGKDTWFCVDNQVGKLNDTITSKYPFQGLDIGRVNFITADSVLWIGGAEGLVQYQFDSPNGRPDPHLIVRSISFGDSMMYFGNGPIKFDEIPYQSNDIRITLAIISNSISDKMSYRYRYDEGKWSAWSEEPLIVESNLPFGYHKFEIVGMDQFGVETAIRSFEFEIAAPWYFRWWAFALYLVALLALIILAVYLGRRRLRKQNIWLEGIVEERTAELQKSYHQIKEQKEEITDSINYAKRIQEAILPRREDIQKSLKEYFVLYKPKDIVSGDFYWFADTGKEQIFVCADCTGHGVPGGFMSMIGSDKLNRKVLEEGYTSPSDILRQLNLGIKQSLKQDGDDAESTKDGMDAAIISIVDNKLRYAGANRSLWIIRDGEINEIKATKAAVAGFTPDDQIYELHEIDVIEGDAIYMTTDGYPDQFGGVKGKKFKLKQMKDLLLEIKDLPMNQQKARLDETIETWMGELEQVDDICVIGIRV